MIPARPRAVLFDLDGTLADSLADITWALSEARTSLALPDVDDGDVRRWIGDGARRLVARSLGTEDDDAPGVVELHERFLDVYRSRDRTRSTLYPGVRPLLDELRTAGTLLACTTNKPRRPTHKLLGLLGVADHFAAVRTPDDVGGRRKPAPDMLLDALDELGVEPSDAVLVGDGLPDVAAARAAGVRVVAVLGGYGGEEALVALRPDATVESAAELRAAWTADDART